MTDQERLAAFERVYAGLREEQGQVLAEMERLRAAGKVRGAAYRQLMAHRLTIQTLLDRFAACGL